MSGFLEVFLIKSEGLIFEGGLNFFLIFGENVINLLKVDDKIKSVRVIEN